MADWTQITGLDLKRGSNSDEYYMCCPFCLSRGKQTADTRYHLGINIKNGKYQCFRCGAKPSETGSIRNFREFALLVEQPPEPNTEFDSLRLRLNTVRTFPQESHFNLDKISWNLNKEQTPIAYNYICNRGFSEFEITKYNLRVGHPYLDETSGQEDSRWSGRILFPYIENQITKYLIGRAYTNREPKYRNCNASRASIVYFLDQVRDRKCILCEGVISAISATRQTGIVSIATLGKQITTTQLSKIRSVVDEVWLSFDGDVTNDIIKPIIFRLIKMGFKIRLIELPTNTDPDDLGVEYVKYFQQARRIYF